MDKKCFQTAFFESSLVTAEYDEIRINIDGEKLFTLFFESKLTESTRVLKVESRDENSFDCILMPTEDIKPFNQQENVESSQIERCWQQLASFLDQRIDEHVHEIEDTFKPSELPEHLHYTDVEAYIKKSLRKSYTEDKGKIIEGLILQLDSFVFHVLGWLIVVIEESLMEADTNSDSQMLARLAASDLETINKFLRNFILKDLKFTLTCGLLEWTESYIREIASLLFYEQEWMPWDQESPAILKELILQHEKIQEIPTVDLKAGKIKELIPIPSNPVLRAAIEAAYNINQWEKDYTDTLVYEHKTRNKDTQTILYLPDGIKEGFSPETIDVFLILMSKIAELPDPRDTAVVTLSELAEYRDVSVRHGSKKKLFNDLKQEVLRLSKIQLSISVSNMGKENIRFGVEEPDVLLDIVDIENQYGDTAFSFRCGQAFSHFLSDDIRWVSYFSREILKLDPCHEGFTKKVGTYWLLAGIIQLKNNQTPHATPKTILDFCGEEVKKNHPGRTVDRFIAAHRHLSELGIINEVPALEPESRTRGYINDWLNINVEVEISEDIWKKQEQVEKTPSSKTSAKQKSSRDKLTAADELTPEMLQEKPSLIRTLRNRFYLHQEEVARHLGISRSMLSRYETGSSRLPDERALTLMDIFRDKME